MSKTLPIALMALLFALPAVAAETIAPADKAAEATPTIASESDRSQKIVCKTEAVIGSRLAKRRTCHTQAEWADYRREVRTHTDKMQTRIARNGD